MSVLFVAVYQQADHWFNNDDLVYHGYRHVQQTSEDHAPSRQISFVITASNNGVLNANDTNDAYSNQTDQFNHHHHHQQYHQFALSSSKRKYKHDVNRIEDNTSPIHILLLSYQRSGSSVISSLFGDNPYIFSLYEPLDSIYTALYGLSPGWSVPADLAISRDGTLR